MTISRLTLAQTSAMHSADLRTQRHRLLHQLDQVDAAIEEQGPQVLDWEDYPPRPAVAGEIQEVLDEIKEGIREEIAEDVDDILDPQVLEWEGDSPTPAHIKANAYVSVYLHCVATGDVSRVDIPANVPAADRMIVAQQKHEETMESLLG